MGWVLGLDVLSLIEFRFVFILRFRGRGMVGMGYRDKSFIDCFERFSDLMYSEVLIRD